MILKKPAGFSDQNIYLCSETNNQTYVFQIEIAA